MSTLPISSTPKITVKTAKFHAQINSIQIQQCISLLELCKYTTEFTQIHSKFIKLNLVNYSLTFTKLLGSISISQFTDMDYAKSVFDWDNNPNTFAYNVIIRGYSQKNQPEKALSMFYEMVSNNGDDNSNNCMPNFLTFPFVLKSCAKLNAVEEGIQIHGQVLKHGLSEDLYVQNSLISLYSGFGLIGLAQQVFDEMGERDLVSWNSMLKGLFDAGFVKEGQMMFDRMPSKNLRTWNCLIDGCVKSGFMEEARRWFDQMGVKRDTITWNSMISGYVNTGDLKDARNLYNQMPNQMKDLITFNLMIDGFATKDEHRCVLEIFQELQASNTKPNNFTLVNVLTSCSHMVALEQGEWIERYITRNKIELNAMLGTALVNMFAKCGKITKSLSIFESMEEKDVEAWNSIIYNLGVHGYGEKALSLFSDMIESSSKYPPDEITFINILSACRHSGLVTEGRRMFKLMIEKYDMTPKVEHYGCMVDLLCRSNLLDEAKELIEAAVQMDSGNDIKHIPMWGALLGASSRVKDVKMGEYAAKRVMELDPSDTSCYVILSNLYSAIGMFDKAVEVRNKMKELGINKDAGYSSIEIDGIVHRFTVGSTDLSNFIADQTNEGVRSDSLFWSVLKQVL